MQVSDPAVLESNGPLLIACNHPNSFLDAIIIATLFKKPVISLARGDAFKNKMAFKILRGLNIYPVYRLSEGAGNLQSNYDTFDECRKIFSKNGIVLIFSEGLCVNEWKLRPLKKGTARLAFSSWQEQIPLKVIPAGINYHSFSEFGKIVKLNFEKPISIHDLSDTAMSGHAINSFNEILNSRMMQVVDHLDESDTETLRKYYPIKSKLHRHPLLTIPAFLGKWLHAPLYAPIQKWSWRNFKGRDHYDSVLLGLLFILYPIYLSLIASIIYLLGGAYYSLLVFIIMPLLAWCHVQWKSAFKVSSK